MAAEEAALYRQAFGLRRGRTAERQRAAAAVILARFLTTHALVGLADVLARYPFERGLGTSGSWRSGPAGRAVAGAGASDGGAAAVVGAGQPGAGAARQPGAPAPRGGHLSAAAVRRLPAALAGRPSRRRAAASSAGLAEVLDRACGIAAAGGTVGADGAAGARARLPAALAGRVDRRRRRRLGLPGRATGGDRGLPPPRRRCANCRRPPAPTLPPLGEDALRCWNVCAARGVVPDRPGR